jgi:hypothetical protein
MYHIAAWTKMTLMAQDNAGKDQCSIGKNPCKAIDGNIWMLRYAWAVEGRMRFPCPQVIEELFAIPRPATALTGPAMLTAPDLGPELLLKLLP